MGPNIAHMIKNGLDLNLSIQTAGLAQLLTTTCLESVQFLEQILSLSSPRN